MWKVQSKLNNIIFIYNSICLQKKKAIKYPSFQYYSIHFYITCSKINFLLTINISPIH